MISPDLWWWPKQPARAPRPRTAWLVTALGAALFGVSALVLKTGTLSWDESLFRVLNEVPAVAASVLTPLSRLFRPAGIVVVVVLAVVYVVARNRSVLPVAAGAGDWPARGVKRQLKSYGGRRTPNDIRCRPAWWPEDARKAVRDHDLAWLVVVAQAADPGSRARDRLAGGGPGSCAVRRFGAVAQDRDARLG